MAAPPGGSSQALGALLRAAGAARAGPSPAWLTLSIPAGWQSQGVSPGLPGASEALWAGTGQEGDVQGQRRSRRRDSSRCPCLEGSLFLPPSAGTWKGGPAASRAGGLVAAYLSCSSVRRCLGIYREDRNRLNSSSPARPASPCSPCVPGLGGSGGSF